MKKLLSSLLCLSMTLLCTGNLYNQTDTDNTCSDIASEIVSNQCQTDCTKSSDKQNETDSQASDADIISNTQAQAQNTQNTDTTDAQEKSQAQTHKTSQAPTGNVIRYEVQSNCDNKQNCGSDDCNNLSEQDACTQNSCEQNSCVQQNCPPSSCTQNSCEQNACDNKASDSCGNTANNTQNSTSQSYGNATSLLDYINSYFNSSRANSSQSTPSTPSSNQTQATPSDNSSSGQASSGSQTSNSEIMRVFELVNQNRIANGLPALSYRNDLQSVANLRAQEITVSFSHTRPNSTSCFTAVSEAGISYTAVGENIAYGQRNADAVMTAWMNSSSHRANILSSKFTGIAIGLVEKNGVKYWVEEFIK